ncbi:MAG TPA: hypothetical protein VHE78_07400 [Gemmatimonadaceae bacterium]|nr:hypothetical protein [Gemmatimonadaceae bacterium]
MQRTLVVALLAAVRFASAQDQPAPPPRVGPGSSPLVILLGTDVTWTPTTGDFRNYLAGGWGLGAHVVQGLTSNMVLAIRGAFRVTDNGSRTVRYPVARPGTNPVLVATTTQNNVTSGSLGVQFTAPTGRVRPYLFGAAGFAFFHTTSELTNADSASRLAKRDFRDGGFGTEVGGGLLIALRGGTVPVILDVGVHSERSDNINLYTEKSVTYTGPAYPPAITTIQTAINAVAYRVGLSLGFR